MLTPAEYQARILADIQPLPVAMTPLLDAHGLITSDAVHSAIPLPPFDNSAMDGYALRLADLTGSTLPVAGESAAGSATATLPPGHAMKVMTGAPIPMSADAVVPYEVTDRGAEIVTISERPARGANIRRQGEDVRIGDVVVEAGTRLTPRHLAVIAAIGDGHVAVHRAPSVEVISTGAELRQPGEWLPDGSIYDSNSTMLTALAAAEGATVTTTVIPDDEQAVDFAVTRSMADLVITTGGVSAGDYDVVKAALSLRGVWFGPLAMQPGKPQGFGIVGNTPTICLPGNPVSAYVSFTMFVRPALRRLMGDPNPVEPTVTARLAAPITSPAGKTQFLRGTYAAGIVSAVGGPGSHLIGALAYANALVVVPADVTRLDAGADVEILLMETR